MSALLNFCAASCIARYMPHKYHTHSQGRATQTQMHIFSYSLFYFLITYVLLYLYFKMLNFSECKPFYTISLIDRVELWRNDIGPKIMAWWLNNGEKLIKSATWITSCCYAAWMGAEGCVEVENNKLFYFIPFKRYSWEFFYGVAYATVKATIAKFKPSKAHIMRWWNCIRIWNTTEQRLASFEMAL